MFRRFFFILLFSSASLSFAQSSNDVLVAKLDILSRQLSNLTDSLLLLRNGGDNFVYTVPLDDDSEFNYLSAWLQEGLFLGGGAGRAYLDVISEQLRYLRNELSSNTNNVPAALLDSISSISTLLSTIDTRLINLGSMDANVYESLQLLTLLDGDLLSLTEYLNQFEYSYGVWHSHVDDNQWDAITSGIQAILDSLEELGSETASDYASAFSDMVNGWDETTAPSWLTRIESYMHETSDTLTDIHTNDLFEIYTNQLQRLALLKDDLVPDVKCIDEDFHKLLSYTTNSIVLPGMSETAGLTNAPSPAAQQREFDQYSSSATSAETQYSSDLTKYESETSYELPTLDFSTMIPGEITPLRAFEPSFDSTPQLADSYSIPILSSDLQAGDVTIHSFSLDLATGSAYDNVMRPFKERIGPITEQIWNLIFAISVLLLAKYEWKAYMAGVGPSVAAHEQQEREDYDGYIF